MDIENYDQERLPSERLVFFLMATYGDGEPTDSATGFMEWLAGAAEGGEELCQVGGLQGGEREGVPVKQSLGELAWRPACDVCA